MDIGVQWTSGSEIRLLTVSPAELREYVKSPDMACFEVLESGLRPLNAVAERAVAQARYLLGRVFPNEFPAFALTIKLGPRMHRASTSELSDPDREC